MKCSILKLNRPREKEIYSMCAMPHTCQSDRSRARATVTNNKFISLFTILFLYYYYLYIINYIIIFILFCYIIYDCYLYIINYIIYIILLYHL